MQIYNQFLPEPQSSLLSGVVLGVRQQLSPEFYQSLSNTGTLHVVVASGYNVTVIAGILSYVVLRVVSRKIAIPFVILGIIFYALMAGADPPVIRAAVMGSVAFIAQFLGKQYHALWSLFLASSLMVFISPLLIFDVGFQLSVVATFGILVVTPTLVQLIQPMSKVVGKGIVEEASVTLGAQLMVLPLLLLHFKKVSWLSPLVNLCIIQLIPLMMGMGGLLAAVGIVSTFFSQLVAFFAWVPLTLFVWTVTFFDRLPFGQLKFNNFSWLWVFGYYLAMFFVIRIIENKLIKGKNFYI